MRNLFLTCLLLISADVLAQPEVRVYYNPFELAGVGAGYSVARWRFELTGSWRQKEHIGIYASSHPDNSATVFEDDVWTESISTITGRFLRTGKKERKGIVLYYGIYFRYTTQNSELTEAHWGAAEEDMATRYSALMSIEYWRIGTGLIFGARGTIAGGVFWDASVSFLPFVYGKRHQYDNKGHVNTELLGGVTYLAEDPAYVLQLGLGYKFGPKKE